MSCRICSSTGDCVLDALETIKIHYIYLKKESEDNKLTIKKLTSENANLNLKIAQLEKKLESSKRRKISFFENNKEFNSNKNNENLSLSPTSLTSTEISSPERKVLRQSQEKATPTSPSLLKQFYSPKRLKLSVTKSEKLTESKSPHNNKSLEPDEIYSEDFVESSQPSSPKQDLKSIKKLIGQNLQKNKPKSTSSKRKHNANFNIMPTPEGFWDPVLRPFPDDDLRNDTLIDERFIQDKYR